MGRFYKHDSPFTYFSSKELHLGEISLECSRAGASAVALWATQRLLPYERRRRVRAGAGDWARGGAGYAPQAPGGFERFVMPDYGDPMLDILFWAR